MGTDSNYIGIDFGTTYSSMARYDPRTGHADIIWNEENEEKTPSLVYFGENETIVGKQVEELIEYVYEDPAELAKVFQRLQVSIKRNLTSRHPISLPDGRRVRPVEVAAEILKKLKSDAEVLYFREEVAKAVITCPAAFDTRQRRLIKEAGHLAGFTDVELLEEPAAGALAYAKTGHKVGKQVLVYDLGGGTFDVAVLINDGDSFPVALEPKGIDDCGGDDFDLALYYHLDDVAQEQLGRSISTTDRLDRRILKLCRSRKEWLSRHPQVTFDAPLSSHSGTVRLVQDIDRDTFETLIESDVAETVRLTADIIAEAAAVDRPVDTVVLVGGSTSIPLVRRQLEKTLPVEPLRWERQNLAVALGAAYRAHERWGPAVSEQVVPDVRGKTRTEAEKVVGEDFELAVARKEDSERPKDTILSQEPAANEQALRSSTISVVLSGGRPESPPIKVPELVGLSESEARGILAAAGLKLGNVSKESSSGVPESRIFEQKPEAGSEVDSGTLVSVTISIGEVHPPPRVHTLNRPREPVLAYAVSPDGRTVVSGDSGGKITLWRLDTEEARTLEGHMGPVRALSVSPDGRTVVSGGQDRTIRLWNSRTGGLQNRFKNTGWWVLGRVCSVAVSPDGRMVVSGDSGGKITLWQTETGGKIRTLEGHMGPVRSVAVSPDGRRVVSGGDDHTVRLWHLDTGNARTLEGHMGPVRSVAVSPDGRRVVSGGDDRKVRLWHLDTGNAGSVYERSGKVCSVSVTSGGLLLSGDSSGTVVIEYESTLKKQVPDRPQYLPD